MFDAQYRLFPERVAINPAEKFSGMTRLDMSARYKDSDAWAPIRHGVNRYC